MEKDLQQIVEVLGRDGVLVESSISLPKGLEEVGLSRISTSGINAPNSLEIMNSVIGGGVNLGYIRDNDRTRRELESKRGVLEFYRIPQIGTLVYRFGELDPMSIYGSSF